MKKFSKDILILTEIAACIALDDFKSIEEKIEIYKSGKYSALKLYECILQSYLFCGFPAAIETLKIFRRYYKTFKLNNYSFNLSKFRSNGEHNCKLIYKKNYKKLIDNMNSLSPELKTWMLIEGYGKVLGRTGIGLLEREFINVAILSSKFYENQLHAHLKGSLNLGATKIELEYLIKNVKSNIGEVNFSKTIKLLNKVYQLK